MTRINSSGSPNSADNSGEPAPRRSAPFKTTSEVLRSLRHGLQGYILSKFGPCHLVLLDGHGVKISVVDTIVAPRFECFSLAVEADSEGIKSTVPFASPTGETEAFALIREEYVEPYNEDTEGLVGSPPRTIQRAAIPGRVPSHALASCQVAYGLLIEGTSCRLMVAADWFPFKIEATIDEDRISEFLRDSEAIPVERYIQQYRPPA
jgi:hypothetical protein